MANLSRTPSQFFISLLIIFMLTMTMYSFFRALGALCASLDVGKYRGIHLCFDESMANENSATRLTGVAIQALVVYTGMPIYSSTWKEEDC